MNMQQDCSPAKLFLCQMIYCSYGFCNEGRSDLCQQLVSSMNQEETSHLKKVETEYLSKLKKGWEPSFSESLSFFSFFPICKQAAEEWCQRIHDTHTLITWFSQVEHWKSNYDEDSEPEEYRDLLYFVSTILAAFSRFSLMQCDSIFNRLQIYFNSHPNPPQWFPPYSVDFTQEQRDLWTQQAQKSLYQHLGEFDINSIQQYLQSIVPQPHYLLASILILKQDYSQALSRLTQSSPPISTLFTLTHYLLSRGQTIAATRLLQQLSILIHLSKRRELDSWLSILQFECSFNPQFLFNTSSFSYDSNSHSYTLFTLLKMSIAQPHILDSLPSTLQNEIRLVLEDKPIVEFQEVLDWAKSSADFGDCLSSYIETHKEIEPFLSSEDRLFVELSQSDAFQRVDDLRTKYCHFKIPILENRSYFYQICSFLRENRIQEALGCLGLWRIELESLSMTQIDSEIERGKGFLLECVCWFRLGNKAKGYECLQRARLLCEENKLALWNGVCELVFVLMSVESGSCVVDGGKRLSEFLALFVKLRQKQMVLWTLGALSIVQSRRDIYTHLLSLPEDRNVGKEHLASWLGKFSQLYT